MPGISILISFFVVIGVVKQGTELQWSFSGQRLWCEHARLDAKSRPMDSIELIEIRNASDEPEMLDGAYRRSRPNSAPDLFSVSLIREENIAHGAGRMDRWSMRDTIGHEFDWTFARSPSNVHIIDFFRVPNGFGEGHHFYRWSSPKVFYGIVTAKSKEWTGLNKVGDDWSIKSHPCTLRSFELLNRDFADALSCVGRFFSGLVHITSEYRISDQYYEADARQNDAQAISEIGIIPLRTGLSRNSFYPIAVIIAGAFFCWIGGFSLVLLLAYNHISWIRFWIVAVVIILGVVAIHSGIVLSLE